MLTSFAENILEKRVSPRLTREWFPYPQKSGARTSRGSLCGGQMVGKYISTPCTTHFIRIMCLCYLIPVRTFLVLVLKTHFWIDGYVESYLYSGTFHFLQSGYAGKSEYKWNLYTKYLQNLNIQIIHNFAVNLWILKSPFQQSQDFDS